MPYKQEVVGSNPTGATITKKEGPSHGVGTVKERKNFKIVESRQGYKVKRRFWRYFWKTEKDGLSFNAAVIYLRLLELRGRK